MYDVPGKGEDPAPETLDEFSEKHPDGSLILPDGADLEEFRRFQEWRPGSSRPRRQPGSGSYWSSGTPEATSFRVSDSMK